MIKKQFTLYVENKPGSLARVSRLLGSAKVNIEGISIAVTGDVGLIQIIVDNAARAAQLLKKEKVPYTVQQVCVLPLPDRPGALAGVTEKMASKKINLNYLYCTTCKTRGCDCSVVVSGDNLKMIEKMWGQALASIGK